MLSANQHGEIFACILLGIKEVDVGSNFVKRLNEADVLMPDKGLMIKTTVYLFIFTYIITLEILEQCT